MIKALIDGYNKSLREIVLKSTTIELPEQRWDMKPGLALANLSLSKRN